MPQFISMMRPGKPGLPESMTPADREIFGAHTAWLRQKYSEGSIIFAGPSMDDDHEHYAIVILDTQTKEDAVSIMNRDPAVACGLLTSVVTDFEVFLSRKFQDPEETAKAPATICYIEIPAPDIEAAGSFYAGVFGWKITPSNLDSTPYWEFSTGDGELSGGLVQERPAHSGGVLLYLKVNDIDTALGRVRTSGGSVIRERFEIGGGYGYSAVFADPNGNHIGLYART